MFENKKVLIGLVVGLILAIVLPLAYGLIVKPSAPKARTGKVNLVIWNLFDEEDAFARIIQEYRNAHPGVNIEYRRFMNPEAYETLLASELAEGKGPDIFVMHQTAFFKERGKLAPMPVNFGGVTPESYKAAFVPTVSRDLVFTETYTQGKEERKRERIYGVPLYVDTLGLFYNEQSLESYTKESFPKVAWAELAEQIRALSVQRGDTLTLSGMMLGDAQMERASDVFGLLFMQFGGEFYDEERKESLFKKGTNGSAKEAFLYFSKFSDPKSFYYGWDPALVADEASKSEVTAFVRGKTAMFLGYSYYIDSLEKAVTTLKSPGQKVIEKKYMKVALSPQVSNEREDLSKVVTYADYYPFGVSRLSKNTDAAWEFLLYLSSSEQMERYFEKTKKPVSKRNLIKPLSEKYPEYAVFLQQTQYAKSPNFMDRRAFDQGFRAVFGAYKKGILSVDEALSALDEMFTCQSGQYYKKEEYLNKACTPSF